MNTRSRIQAVLELTLAAAFWGFGFIAIIWSMRSMGPFSISGWRFLVAFGVGYAIAFLVPSLRKTLDLKTFWLAAIPGFFLSATLMLQTYGLKYTTATKSGFITTLYVLIVPLLELWLLKRRPPRGHFFFVSLAMIGVALICGLLSNAAVDSAKQGLNFGDLLTLGCSIAASFHILWFALIHDKIKSAFAFNHFQSFWACLIPLTVALVTEPLPKPNWADLSLQGFLMLTFGSTLIGFALQVRAQKKISPSLAALLFLLESPFATLFAIYFLAENLQLAQWMGAGLIMIAAVMSTLFTKEVSSAEAKS